ncbi:MULTISPECIES: cobalt-precorrin-6A reductase [unclassified Okeania]|uniref:Cobalt-precorrin-6A reductase n=3 Tax=Microcoleaceae TaxID=1892252 RepID=A0A3N6NHA4_9CYAN|nr:MULTISPECIES: cobalt-precorrin-6A reductase [unclassified Okeania]NES93528.1 cobalt-precorrin-6A reductase [Okeania sp. SIO2B9]NET13663.1 cobalt-precorrin-6A reductase [Okeania sp. SIO1H6]NET79301.1 cobalt-precorrin-6A reductase [Okeania sp. SIO1F9]RQH14315.1 cobalt-precorrin-6A reductase [Okeania hirsuta]NES77824.1 cobalt-precorrin-6A reductase [Okeania sp. SIO1H4]
MTKQKRVLILGGTGNGWKLAALATTIPGLEVINSLAGRTRQPSIKFTHTRIGSFGGVPGLTEYLQAQQIDLLIDATHPFAVQISWNAAIATSELNIPHLMLISPPWEKTEGDRWVEVENKQTVIEILPKLAQRVFLSIGRQELASYAHLQNLWFLMRTIDPPKLNTLLPPGKLLTKRGPFSLLEERSLLQKYKIEAIVSKNSGGDATYAKIIAARELGIPVVMIQRPPLPDGKQVTDVESAVSWLRIYSD